MAEASCLLQLPPAQDMEHSGDTHQTPKLVSFTLPAFSHVQAEAGHGGRVNPPRPAASGTIQEGRELELKSKVKGGEAISSESTSSEAEVESKE